MQGVWEGGGSYEGEGMKACRSCTLASRTLAGRVYVLLWPSISQAAEGEALMLQTFGVCARMTPFKMGAGVVPHCRAGRRGEVYLRQMSIVDPFLYVLCCAAGIRTDV